MATHAHFIRHRRFTATRAMATQAMDFHINKHGRLKTALELFFFCIKKGNVLQKENT
jgi:hypothetical protein